VVTRSVWTSKQTDECGRQTTRKHNALANSVGWRKYNQYSGITRKHRQSYRHVDPRQQQQHTAVAARVTSNHDGFHNHVTLTSDSMHAERLLQSISVPSLVLITQAVFLLECGQTDRHTDATECPTHAGGYTAGMGNDQPAKNFLSPTFHLWGRSLFVGGSRLHVTKKFCGNLDTKT